MSAPRVLLVLLAASAPALVPTTARADSDEQTAWGAWFASTELQDRCSLTSDVQLRSSDDRDVLASHVLQLAFYSRLP